MPLVKLTTKLFQASLISFLPPDPIKTSNLSGPCGQLKVAKTGFAEVLNCPRHQLGKLQNDHLREKHIS